MTVLSVARYRTITGDETSVASAVEARIAEAVDELEEILDRPLEHGEHTEALSPTRDGWLWPRATPIAEVDGYEVSGNGLRSSSPWGWPSIVGADDGSVSVTYTGGWRAHDDPAVTDADRLPFCIERDLAWAAWRLGRPVDTSLASTPAGASSVRLGDASVTMAAGAALPGLGSHAGWWSRRTRSYRHQVIGGVLCC